MPERMASLYSKHLCFHMPIVELFVPVSKCSSIQYKDDCLCFVRRKQYFVKVPQFSHRKKHITLPVPDIKLYYRFA